MKGLSGLQAHDIINAVLAAHTRSTAEERAAWFDGMKRLLGKLGSYGKGAVFWHQYAWGATEYPRILEALLQDWNAFPPRSESECLDALRACYRPAFSQLASRDATARRLLECVQSDDAAMSAKAVEAVCNLTLHDRCAPPGWMNDTEWRYPQDMSQNVFAGAWVATEFPNVRERLVGMVKNHTHPEEAVWLLGAFDFRDVFDVVVPLFMAGQVDDVTPYALTALQHVDPNRYVVTMHEATPALLQILTTWMHTDADLDVYVVGALLSALVGESPEATKAWLRSALYDEATKAKPRAVLARWLASRYERWSFEILADARSDSGLLSGLSPAAALQARAYLDLDTAYPQIVAYLQKRVVEKELQSWTPDSYEEDIIRNAAYTAARKGDATLAALLFSVGERLEPRHRWAVEDALHNLSENGTPELRATYLAYAGNARNTAQRHLAVAALGFIETWQGEQRDQCRMAVRPFLNDKTIAGEAALLLLQLDDDESVPQIISLTPHLNSNQAIAVAHAMSWMGGRQQPQGVAGLMQMYGYATDAKVRKSIAQELARSQDPRVPRFARQSLATESDPATRDALTRCVKMATLPAVLSPWQVALTIAGMATLVLIVLRSLAKRRHGGPRNTAPHPV
jgi:hypothetical protein